MSQECISLTPVARRRIYSARYSLTPSTGAAFGTTHMRPVSATVPQIVNVFPNNERGAEVVEFKLWETATSEANIKKLPIRFVFYKGVTANTAPTGPTLGADYAVNPITDAQVAGVIRVTAADYKYVSDGVYCVTLNAASIVSNGGTAHMIGGVGSAGRDLYAVAIYDSSTTGGPYAASATLDIELVTEYEAG